MALTAGYNALSLPKILVIPAFFPNRWNRYEYSLSLRIRDQYMALFFFWFFVVRFTLRPVSHAATECTCTPIEAFTRRFSWRSTIFSYYFFLLMSFVLYFSYRGGSQNVKTNGDIRRICFSRYRYRDTCITILVSSCETNLIFSPDFTTVSFLSFFFFFYYYYFFNPVVSRARTETIENARKINTSRDNRSVFVSFTD